MSRKAAYLVESAANRLLAGGLGLLLFCGGCCPYSRGLIADVTAHTTLSKAEAFRDLDQWLQRSGYRIWQADSERGYIRASLIHASASYGFEVEDVLSATIVGTAGNAQLQVQAETYTVSGRREKIKVSKEAKQALSFIKENLALSGTNAPPKP